MEKFTRGEALLLKELLNDHTKGIVIGMSSDLSSIDKDKNFIDDTWIEEFKLELETMQQIVEKIDGFTEPMEPVDY